LTEVPEWPIGYSLGKDRRWLFYEGKTCVPSGLVPFVIREHHESQSAHVGVDRTILELDRFYIWKWSVGIIRELVRKIVRHCVVCQVFKSGNVDLRVKMRSTLVPDVVGDHMVIDIFQMPLVRKGGEVFDCFIIAMDRLSGYTIVEPARTKGLTSKGVSLLILPKWFDVFGYHQGSGQIRDLNLWDSGFPRCVEPLE